MYKTHAQSVESAAISPSANPYISSTHERALALLQQVNINHQMRWWEMSKGRVRVCQQTRYIHREKRENKYEHVLSGFSNSVRSPFQLSQGPPCCPTRPCGCDPGCAILFRSTAASCPSLLGSREPGLRVWDGYQLLPEPPRPEDSYWPVWWCRGSLGITASVRFTIPPRPVE